jgi:hypothetical protein
MHVWLSGYRARLANGIGLVLAVLALRRITSGGTGPIPAYMYGAGLVLMVAFSAISSTMFVAQMAFYNRVSDPRIGGTYMTMLNTMSNLGGQWPNTFMLLAKGTLDKYPAIDSFSIVCAASAAVGCAWLNVMTPRVHALQAKPMTEWQAAGA